MENITATALFLEDLFPTTGVAMPAPYDADVSVTLPYDTNASLAFNLSDPNGRRTGPANPRGPYPPGGHSVSPDILALKTIFRQLDAVMPVVLSLGLVGNVVAVLALLMTPLRASSLSHYLTALSVADMLNLLASLVLWVSQHGWNIYSKVGVCQITSFLLLMSR